MTVALLLDVVFKHFYALPSTFDLTPDDDLSVLPLHQFNAAILRASIFGSV